VIFAWDEWNIDHISRHGVTPAEAEFVVVRARAPWPEQKGEDNLLVWGPTDVGWLLQIIFVLRAPDQVQFDSLTIDQWADLDESDRIIYIVHGMELTPAMKTSLSPETKTPMKVNHKNKESFEDLDKLAHETNDIRPLTPAMRREWQAARRTGTKRRVGRPAKDPRLKSRIIPISIEPALLAKIDKLQNRWV